MTTQTNKDRMVANVMQAALTGTARRWIEYRRDHNQDQEVLQEIERLEKRIRNYGLALCPGQVISSIGVHADGTLMISFAAGMTLLVPPA